MNPTTQPNRAADRLLGLCLSTPSRSVLIVPDADTNVPILNTIQDHRIDYTPMALVEYINQQKRGDGSIEAWFVHKDELSRCLKNIVSVFGDAVPHPVTGRID